MLTSPCKTPDESSLASVTKLPFSDSLLFPSSILYLFTSVFFFWTSSQQPYLHLWLCLILPGSAVESFLTVELSPECAEPRLRGWALPRLGCGAQAAETAEGGDLLAGGGEQVNMVGWSPESNAICRRVDMFGQQSHSLGFPHCGD